MASLEQDIQQARFDSEHLKANINILYTANWLYNKISANLKPFNLTHEQFNVLRILKGSHPRSMCQKDVKCRMIAPNSNVTLIIKKLIDKELVQVAQAMHDKREYQINITVTGMMLLEDIAKKIQRDDNRYNNLTVSEAFHLNALLDKMRSDTE
jgi:DNA-binding MarR family transcriptional regulator